MHANHVLLDLVVVIGAAALISVLFQALRQPLVLGYLLAGLVVGPHLQTGIEVDAELVTTLSELGVMLLMFSIGLEFSIRTIAKVGLGAALSASVEVAGMVALGYVAGIAFGWDGVASLFLGACVAISSTMLVARAVEDRSTSEARGRAEVVLAILVFEDLFAILLLAVLTAVASGAGLSGASLVRVIGELAGFLAALLVGGLLIVPRAIRWIAKVGRGETLVITSLAVCVGMAALATAAGYSIALGAFLAGLLVAESGRGHDVEALIRPFRDAFAAIFFVAVGMAIDPRALVVEWRAIAMVSALVIAGKAIGGGVGAFLAGHGVPRAVRIGATLTQIGEFSFIIAGVGVAAGAAPASLLPIVVGVACVTAFASPWLARGSERVASWIDRRLPARLQTFVTFYGSWIERLRASADRDTRWRRLRGPMVLLLVDAALVGGVAIGATAIPRDRGALTIALVAAAVLGGALFLFGVFRCVRQLARRLASEVIPAGDRGTVDLGSAPRRVLVLTLELAIVLVVGVPVTLVVAPFLPAGALVLAIAVIAIALAFWRAMSNLHGHALAGSALIVEALAAQTQGGPRDHQLDQVASILPGFAGLAPIELRPDSPAVGRTLAELDIRARTGATVLALTRVGAAIAFPSPQEPLRAGDLLALSGSDDAVGAARALLAGESLQQ